jgi:hydroxyacylglutathione hydrolase
MAGSWEWVVDGGVRVGVTTSRRDHTTSTVLISDRSALLVDPAWEPDELAWIARDLAGAGITVTAGFATHAHHDHVLWHPGLGAAPRWASAVVARDAIGRRAALIEALGPGWPAEVIELVGTLSPATGDTLPWDGPAVEMITHDAHAPGHTALWLPRARTLIAGDMLSDRELPLLETSSTTEYASGLLALRPFVDRARVLVPGHGTPAIGSTRAQARWAADHRYLDALEAGRDPQDARLHHSGMREAHEHNQSRAGR